MSRILGRLFAVLLAASCPAYASLILTPPQEVLARSFEKTDPTPAFGPKFHMTSGPVVEVFPPGPQPPGMESFSILGLGIPIAALILALIPVCQRVALLLRLMD